MNQLCTIYALMNKATKNICRFDECQYTICNHLRVSKLIDFNQFLSIYNMKSAKICKEKFNKLFGALRHIKFSE